MNKIEWNKVIYDDCMNEKNGLTTLPDKSIDLCFTDIPFGVNLSQNHICSSGKPSISKKKDLYEDSENFPLLTSFFNEVLRICNGVIIYCGLKNLGFFMRLKNPRQVIYCYKSNGWSRGSFSRRLTVTPMVCYGKFNNRIRKDIFFTVSLMGILRPKNQIKHPCPLNPDFVRDLLKQIKPDSVLDPFLGSGIVAQVCSLLGIKWFGYEINKLYKHDISYNLSQKSLKYYLNGDFING